MNPWVVRDYYVTFIDDFSRKTIVYMIKNKSEVLEKFKVFKAIAENITGERVKILRTDNGGEYTSNAFNSFCESCGIQHQLSAPHSPQHNGVAERANGTIMEAALSMLHASGLPMMTFWGEAVSTAVYLKNRSPHKALELETPEQAWTGNKPNVSHLRTFGCAAYAQVDANDRNKLESKTSKCIFVGYADESKAYRLYNPVTKSLFKSPNVVFNEHCRFSPSEDPGATLPSEVEPPVLGVTRGAAAVEGAHPLPPSTFEMPVIVTSDGVQVRSDAVESTQTPQVPPGADSPGRAGMDYSSESAAVRAGDGPEVAIPNEPEPIQTVPEPVPDPVPRQSSRIRRPTQRFDPAGYAAVMEDPSSYIQAMKSEEAAEWKAACKSEMDSLAKNGSWDLVELPKGRKAIPNRWVFRTKLDSAGVLERRKARLVAKGFAQLPGLDYADTFAPVTKLSSIRLLLSIAASLNLEVHQMDVKTAFLHGDLNEDLVYAAARGLCRQCTTKFCLQIEEGVIWP